MPQVQEDRLISTYNTYLKGLFGCRVYKVSVDAGFSCPNRDGSKGRGGCIFCDEMGSSSRTNPQNTSLQEQILENIKVRRTRYRAKKFIVYFQSFTNTYASVGRLKELYDEAISVHSDIVGLAISTRPDCVDREKLALIASYRDRLPYVSVEYGMQTKHDRTLRAINRCEKHADFLRAIADTNDLGLDHCVHTVLGLPGESSQDQLETADTLAALKVRGVKIHLLVAMKNTPLAIRYRRGDWSPLSFEEYLHQACDFIERLHPETIVHRLTVNGHSDRLVAPRWVNEINKAAVMDGIMALLRKRGGGQGAECRYLD